MSAINALRHDLETRQPHIKGQTGLGQCYDEFDEESLSDDVRHPENAVARQKSVGSHKLLGALSIRDDFAATSVMHNQRGILARLAVRGRHACASLILSSPSYDAIYPFMRT